MAEQVKDLILTFKCNNRCIYCSTLLDTRVYRERPFEEIMKEIGYIKKSVKTIILTGGEPTICKEIIKILDKLWVEFPETTIEISTNGRMFYYENFIKKLKKFKKRVIIRVSYPSHKGSIYTRLTKVSKGLEQVNQGIKNLLNTGFRVDLIIIINSINFTEIEEQVNYIINNFKGINKIYFRNLELIRKAFINRDSLAVRYKDILPFMEKAIIRLHKEGIKVELLNFPICVVPDALRGRYISRKASRPYEVEFPVCNNCDFIDVCSGIEKTYAYHFGLEEFKPINVRVDSDSKISEVNKTEEGKTDIIVNQDRCNLCGNCKEICPTGAIELSHKIGIDKKRCILCNSCIDVCKKSAIKTRRVED